MAKRIPRSQRKAAEEAIDDLPPGHAYYLLLVEVAGHGVGSHNIKIGEDCTGKTIWQEIEPGQVIATDQPLDQRFRNKFVRLTPEEAAKFDREHIVRVFAKETEDALT